MAKSVLSPTRLATALIAAPPPAPADDDPIMVIVHFHPTPGREEELKARLLRLRDIVHAHAAGVTYRLYCSRTEPVVFLLHEMFPSPVALGDQARTIFPALQREHGPIPVGIGTRPVEPERFREVLE